MNLCYITGITPKGSDVLVTILVEMWAGAHSPNAIRAVLRALMESRELSELPKVGSARELEALVWSSSSLFPDAVILLGRLIYRVCENPQSCETLARLAGCRRACLMHS